MQFYDTCTNDRTSLSLLDTAKPSQHASDYGTALGQVEARIHKESPCGSRGERHLARGSGESEDTVVRDEGDKEEQSHSHLRWEQRPEPLAPKSKWPSPNGACLWRRRDSGYKETRILGQ